MKTLLALVLLAVTAAPAFAQYVPPPTPVPQFCTTTCSGSGPNRVCTTYCS